jgi:hypothetical protein
VSQAGEFAALAPGGQVYFHADVKRVRPILSHVVLKNINMKQTLGLLDKVDFLSGAVYPKEPPGSRTMLLHAWRRRGNIPGGGFLAMSSQWKKTPSLSGAPYWHSAAYGLSVSIQKKEAFVSDGDPFIDGSPVEAPESLDKIRSGPHRTSGLNAPVLGWLENAGTPVNNFLSRMGIPVRIPTERILFAIDEAPGLMYEIALRVETRNANQAKALVSILALVLRQTEGLLENAPPGTDGELLKIFIPLLANPPAPDGSDVRIRSSPMTPEAIALLLNRITVYSH